MLCIWGTSIIIQPKLGVDTCAFFFLALRKRGLRCQMKKDKKTNNCQRNTTQQTKDLAIRISLKLEYPVQIEPLL